MRSRFSLCAIAMIAAASSLLPGCTFNAPARQAPALYGLGERVTHLTRDDSIPGTLLIPPVSSPAWLETTGMVYRLNYDDPKRLRAYSSSRWVAPPATLLTEALRSRFAGPMERMVSGVDGAQADRSLKIELEDYTQSFDAPDRSRVRLRARATLWDTRGRSIIAQRTFTAEDSAPPNAAGAAEALADRSGEFIENVLDWVSQNLKNSGAATTAERSAR